MTSMKTKRSDWDNIDLATMLIPQVRKTALFQGWIAEGFFFLVFFGFGTSFLFFQEVSHPDPELWWQEREWATLQNINSQNLRKCFPFVKWSFLQQDSESFHVEEVHPDGRPKHTSAVVAHGRTVDKTAVTSSQCGMGTWLLISKKAALSNVNLGDASWWIWGRERERELYSGLELMTILGHRLGSPSMSALLRTHRAASVLSQLMTATCLWPVL